jgi:aspartate/methionine/tyrosine aminotransferase
LGFDSGTLSTAVQIARRRAAHLLKNPDAKIISLGIGDTTEPIPEVITNAMAEVPHLFLNYWLCCFKL